MPVLLHSKTAGPLTTSGMACVWNSRPWIFLLILSEVVYGALYIEKTHIFDCANI